MSPRAAQSSSGAGTGSTSRGLRRRISQETQAFVTILGLKVLCWLPDVVVWNLADFAGNVSYRIAGARRDRARSNLRRVVGYLVANGLANEQTAQAASDPRVLESMVKAAFRHHATYYVELARIPRFGSAWIQERMGVDTPEEVAEWRSYKGPQILIGMHFGAIELPGRFAIETVGRFTAPMETLANARIQRYIVSIRDTANLTILTLEQAGSGMLAALRRGEAVGIVADRDLTGGGVEIELFGARTRVPAGAALLSMETGAPIYVSGVRRTGHGRYRGCLWRLPEPQGENRRERSRNVIAQEARSFEKLVATAPEQWLTIFHSIWPDLEEAAA